MSLQTGAVTLADVVSRGVVVQWFEGVALVQEICGAIESQPDGVAPPDLSSISISADGTVSVRSGAADDTPVVGLGRLLSDLIAQDAQVPPPLRLCISQATVRPAVFASVRDLSERLGYFERPDGPALIRAIYERYVLAPPTQSARPRPVVAESTPAAKAPKQPIQRRRSSHSIGRYLVVAGTTTAVCFAVVVGLQNLPQAQAAVAAPAVEPSRKAPRARGGNARLRTGGASSQAPALAASPTSGRAANDDGVFLTDDQVLLQSRRMAEIPIGLWLDVPAAIESAGSPEPVGRRIEAYEHVDVFANHIYSSADAGVEPAVMVYPHLPAVPSDAADAITMNALEVVIGEDGTVQHVRLVSPPRRLTDMMLLSAARSWEFTPARLDGAPVRYRVTIRWAVPQP